jgi:hypothetical protein
MSTHMFENHMVAVCDILGYSNLVREHSLQELVNYHLINIVNVVKSSIPSRKENTSAPTQVELLKTGAVGHVSFSDTVIIFSLADNRDGRKNVLDAVYRLLCIPMNTPYYRYRIGIAYGEMHVDINQDIYIGKALVEAHDLEVLQEWSGASLTDSAANVFKNYYPENSMIVDSDVPIKGNTTRRLSVVNWTLANHKIVTEQENWMWRSEKGQKVSCCQVPEIEQKIRNTERFHRDVCVQCNAKKS